MSQSITDIVQQLRDSDKKVQLIYGSNGTGKTRLSRTFKEVVAPKEDNGEEARAKILYYNAFTEDLFYWDNDLEGDLERKLLIQPNAYTQWALVDQGQDQNAITHFQRYTDDKLTPHFNEEYTKEKDGETITVSAFSEVTFSFERGNEERSANVKISKGEESNFIWSIFYAVIEQVIDVLNDPEPSERETDKFDLLEYIFIDDPVSSLDENHLIELAVDLADLIKHNTSELKFIISTHNPLFFNVLANEFNRDDNDKAGLMSWRKKWLAKYRLKKAEDESCQLIQQPNDSPLSYHLFLKSELEKAVETGQIHKYHFNFLRNILEKTSTFLGYQKWGDLLPQTNDGRPNPYESRIINISSHSRHAGEETKDLTKPEKQMIKRLLNHLTETYKFFS